MVNCPPELLEFVKDNWQKTDPNPLYGILFNKPNIPPTQLKVVDFEDKKTTVLEVNIHSITFIFFPDLNALFAHNGMRVFLFENHCFWDMGTVENDTEVNFEEFNTPPEHEQMNNLHMLAEEIEGESAPAENPLDIQLPELIAILQRALEAEGYLEYQFLIRKLFSVLN